MSLNSVNDDRAIGIFDSGLGGLTVYRALRGKLPDENFVYLGDTARLPYGTKSPETVTQYALQAAKLLMKHDIKLLVVACNTASAHALAGLEKALPSLPCMGVIEPGADAAFKASATGRILVLATEGTVRSGAYANALKRRDDKILARGIGCNLLVGMVEEGWCEGFEAEAVLRRYLSQAEDFSYDTIVLGCTHFPMLVGAIRRLLPENVRIVDSAATTATAVDEYLSANGIKSSGRENDDVFLVTDAPERFYASAQKFLAGMQVGNVTQVVL